MPASHVGGLDLRVTWAVRERRARVVDEHRVSLTTRGGPAFRATPPKAPTESHRVGRGSRAAHRPLPRHAAARGSHATGASAPVFAAAHSPATTMRTRVAAR